MKLSVDILAFLCIAVGLFPAYMAGSVLAMAVQGMLQSELPYYSLKIWHGFNLALLMSVFAVVGGVLIYRVRLPLAAFYHRHFAGIDARKPYGKVIDAVYQLAVWVTRRLDRGTLHNMIVWLLVATLTFGLIAFGSTGGVLFGPNALTPVDLVTVVAIAGLILSSLLTVLLHRQRFISLVTLGLVGLVISLGFAKFSAPDLALTQLSVEIVTVVLLMLALYFLPQYTPVLNSKSRHYRDIFWAVGTGLGAAILTLSILTRETLPISGYFLRNSVSGGGGTNVVNVILVDFRGFDTLGEIVVLALAGLGIFALLQNINLYAPKQDSTGRVWNRDIHPLILQTQARILFPLMLMIAAFIFIRGHNLPGGGFIAGLIAALAIILQNLANGIEWTSKRLPTDMHYVIASGLSFALGTGLVAIVFGYPFLTSTFTYLNWPVVGKFEVASAMMFDLGVFLVVVGATVMILVQIGRLSYVRTDAQVEPEYLTDLNLNPSTQARS